MAGPGYLGWALQAGVKSFQTSFNMGMQITKLKWQKEQQKKIDDLNILMSDTWNSIGQEIIALTEDKYFSDDDELKIHVLTIAAPYQMQAEMGKLRSFLSDYRKKDFDKQMLYMKTYVEYAQGVDPKDIDSQYKMLHDSATDPHVLALLEVADKKLRHDEGVKEEERALDIVGELPEKYKYEYLKGEGIVGEITPTPEAPAIKDYSDAWNYLDRYKDVPPETFNKVKPGFQKQFPDIDMTDITQEALLSGVEPEPEPTPPTAPAIENVRGDIKNAPNIEDARRIEKNHIAKYGDTLDIPDVDKFWSDERVKRLTTLKQGIDKLLDEKKRLKKGTITSADVGFEIEDDIQKVEAVYQQLREEYMKYRDMLEKMGVDVSQFPELMSYEEYLKADIKPGMGIFYPSTWFQQKPPLY